MRTRSEKPNAEAAANPHDPAEPVSRSARRREALDVLRLAHALADMSDAQLAALPLDDELREEAQRARAVRQPIARKRQTQFLAKQMRKLGDAELGAIGDALDHGRAAAQRDTAALHRVEHWRARLIDEGDPALEDLLRERPDVDRQQLRQLARLARSEHSGAKPPHAYRELFRRLREILQS